MCGLVGYATTGRLVSEAILREMTDTLVHRGPDSAGYWLDGDAGVALGHRRLAIIDVSPAGHQPMVSPSERFVLVFNGEIYNHAALRVSLEKQVGIEHWKGGSDTETLLAGFDAWGIRDTLTRSEGMFAFAVWDRQRRELTLARDRFGEKPLYYGFSKGTLLFGSELKALTKHPAWRGVLAEEEIEGYLRFGCIGGDQSIFRGIKKLAPGSLVSLDQGCVARAELPDPLVWWSAADAASSATHGGRFARGSLAVEAVGDVLAQSVEQRMIADVPLGAFLSGGVDSSLIAALMQERSSRPVKTFAVGFDDARYDESRHAAAVADNLGTDHTTLVADSRMVLDLVPQLASIYDEPFADSSQLPTLLICRLIREHVTVALSGDGGDELFAGYNRHVWVPRLWRYFSKMPVTTRRVVANSLKCVQPAQYDEIFKRVGHWLPKRYRLRTFGEKVHKLASAIDSSDERQLFVRASMMNSDAAAYVSVSGRRDQSSGDAIISALSRFSGVEWMLLRDTLRYMVDDVLVKVDRASMANSLEVRLPFLDTGVFDTAWRISADDRSLGGNKPILRDLLYRYVPRALIDRPKMGFAVPLDEWLRGPLKAWGEDLLFYDPIAELPMLNRQEIRSQWRAHQSGKANNAQALWAVLQLVAWNNQWRAQL